MAWSWSGGQKIMHVTICDCGVVDQRIMLITREPPDSDLLIGDFDYTIEDWKSYFDDATEENEWWIRIEDTESINELIEDLEDENCTYEFCEFCGLDD